MWPPLWSGVPWPYVAQGPVDAIRAVSGAGDRRLLALGLRRGDRPLRAAALAVASLARAKTFLLDSAELAGLYRAASFLALGLCLVAVGWLHRRFVAAAAAPDA